MTVAEAMARALEHERRAPHGRCALCNLALDESDTKYKHGMHNTCAGEHYE